MSGASVVFHDVTVQYPVYDSRSKSLRQQLVRLSTGGLLQQDQSGVTMVTALKEVSFALAEGDRVGIVGHNGAGKSTLLRTIAGIYVPVAGRVRTEGRIATLLELGAGLDPELSGYENIARMSRLLGRTAAQVRAALPDIEAFSQLGDFLNLPVRAYSSGMVTRLMFAIATADAPDILLLDEVFDAGDAEFQGRARERIEGLIERVGILVFASHEHEKIRRYCTRFFHIQHGQVAEVGATDF